MDTYHAESVVDYKEEKENLYYKIRWYGYGSSDDSFVISNEMKNCEQLNKTFWTRKSIWNYEIEVPKTIDIGKSTFSTVPLNRAY
jgi:hypothetical protein